MIQITNNSLDPTFNLALEEYALEHLFPDQELVILWQNEPTVVIGRNQNTIAEVNQSYIQKHNINVVRRLSGGGAVYHDLGNLNFTYIVPEQKNVVSNFEKFTQPILEALQSLNVPAKFAGRNDLVIDNKKFSGNAQYWYKERLLHHGTILFNSDLSVVQKALQVKEDKLQAKGIKSVQSRVTNVSSYLTTPIRIDEFKKVIIYHLLQGRETTNYQLSATDLINIRSLQEKRYASWTWNYGHSPAFSQEKSKRFAGGTLDLKFNVKQGVIQELHIYGDFFGRRDSKELAQKLQGRRYEKQTIHSLLAKIPLEEYFLTITLDEFLTCLFH